MLYARPRPGDDERIAATPHAVGYCGICHAPLVAKCGDIIVHHWAHRTLTDCDTWGEESDWHRAWKGRFPPRWTEVTVGAHRADVKAPGGLVIEFQRSYLAPAQIRAREDHYGAMLWVFDARHTEITPCGEHNLTIESRGSWTRFRWRWPRTSLAFCRAPVWLDLGDRGVFDVRSHTRGWRGGSGHLLDADVAPEVLYGRAMLSSTEWEGGYADAPRAWRGLYPHGSESLTPT